MRSTKLTQSESNSIGGSTKPSSGRTIGTVLLGFVLMLSIMAVGQPSADASESEFVFAIDEVLRFGETCPEGTRDVGHPDHARRLAICRPDGFVPIATPFGSSAMCDLAREAGAFGVWYEGDPVSVCLYGFSYPVPAAGCSPFAIETTLFVRFAGGDKNVCARPVLVKDLSAAPSTALSAVVPICVNDDALLADDAAANRQVGDIYRGVDGKDYLVTTGAWCGFDCVDGFDVNCDGKLGDYCPSEFDRRTVAGAKACLASIAVVE